MDNMSPADMRAVMDGNDDFGGGAWWIIILFLFMFGMGGWNGNGRNDAATQEILFGQQFQGLDQKIDRIGNGICDSTFALNNSILGEGRALQTQLAECCCTTNRNIDNVRFENAQNTCAITSAIHADGEATRALIKESEIQSLRDKVSELQLAQSQCSQNAYLVNMLRPYPIPAYQTANPLATNCCGCYCG